MADRDARELHSLRAKVKAVEDLLDTGYYGKVTVWASDLRAALDATAPFVSQVDSWSFGIGSAARLVARVSAPFEATDERERWTSRLLNDSEFCEQVIAQAHARLLSASTILRARHLVIASLGPGQTDGAAQ